MKSKTINQDVYTSIVIYVVLIIIFTVATKLPDASSIFPKMLIIILAILNTAVLYKGIKKTQLMREDNSNVVNLINIESIKVPIIVFVLAVIYIILFRYTNYFIATTTFMIVLMRFYKIKSWKNIIIITLIFNVIVYIGFVKMLNVPLI